jgi:hypothetical protein
VNIAGEERHDYGAEVRRAIDERIALEAGRYAQAEARRRWRVAAAIAASAVFIAIQLVLFFGARS